MVYLEITLNVNLQNRADAAQVYQQYKAPFLNNIEGALSKELLLREQDVQVLHGFDNLEHANAYLESDLFKQDVVQALAPLLETAPDIRVYQRA